MSPATRPTDPALPPTPKRRSSSRGQILIIYVMAIFVFVGMLAVVVDISWYWINSNRIQKAADASALAGVVWLPGNEAKAVQTAILEAAKNGYTVATSGVPVGGVTLTAAADTTNPHRLVVSISAPVGTFFMRVFGLTSIPAVRNAKAEYVLPVPMGSPENYYGVFGNVRNATMTTTTTQPPSDSTGANTAAGPRLPTTSPGTANWTTTPSGTLVAAVTTQDTTYARTSTAALGQQWGTFGLATAVAGSPIPNPVVTNPTTSINITGITVSLDDIFLSAACASSQIGVRLTWNGGVATPTWSTQVKTPNLAISTTTGDYVLGSQTDTLAWGAHPWIRNDFTDANFRLELQALKGCATAGIQFNVDQIRVTVYYTISTHTIYAPVTATSAPATYQMYGPGSACDNGISECYKSDLAGGGQVLNPRGFWATMNTEGAINLNGDAFQPYYDNTGPVVAPACPTATLRACYDPTNYYNYAVEMPPNSTGGYVYIFDPVFCQTATGSGTGDRYFAATAGVSSYYELWTTGLNLYSTSDDALIVTSGTKFQGMQYSDQTMGGANYGTDCRQTGTGTTPYNDARDFHDSWYRLNPANPLTGGPTGTTYRIHTTGTDPLNPAAQQGANGEQSFAIYATGSALPKVYGLGAMQMFTPLTASSSPNVISDFYLAQIDVAHAGKTLALQLWDPGDTSPLIADLAVMIPTATVGTWTPTPFTYSAAVGTSGSGPNLACNTNTSGGSTVNSVQTSSGAAVGNFNGCWLTLSVPIPPSYAAYQSGWWKIRYTMHDSQAGPDTSNDVTTWTAAIQQNPVHLVVP
ncbi:MAG: hypothetical protein QOI37_396 [Chloroflexota bacterium]|nr:hypothetical protein [Chloroflexota bacterium]